MKKSLLLLLILSLFSCSLFSKGSGYKQITQDEAYALMSDANVIILDVRTVEEYKSGHIANAINIPNETISENVKDILKDKNAKILVYCRSGNRSKQASKKLARLGYTNIMEFGGINTWRYGIVK